MQFNLKKKNQTTKHWDLRLQNKHVMVPVECWKTFPRAALKAAKCQQS